MSCQNTKKAPPPAAVEVMFVKPSERQITEFEEFTGRTAAVYTIDVRARVSGYLDTVDFKDGAEVKAGQLLFTIDDRPYQAESARAAATVAQLEARRIRLEKQDKRARQLIQTQAMTQEEYDTLAADVKENAALVDAAVADQELADLHLSFTKIASPIEGIISRRLVDAGNLVKADDTILATVVSSGNVHVNFDVDERTELRLRRLLRDGKLKSTAESRVEVQIALADETKFSHVGEVDFTDNQIDPATGTLRYRAVVKNAAGFLSPGLFVRVRYPIGEEHEALVVPEEALASDQGQRYVYLVGEDNKIVYQRVKTGVLQGAERVILEGLRPADRVVVTGLQRIRPKMDVAPIPWTEDSPQTAETTKPAEKAVVKTH